MGYTTEFEGTFHLNRPLNKEHAAYLLAFAHTRRMKRDPERASALPDPVRQAVGLPIGPEGAYFVGGRGFHGQDEDESVLDDSTPPQGQPSLWCNWIPGKDQQTILWNGIEKFHRYATWLRYLIQHFLAPWGYTLHGEVRWHGEMEGDAGVIRVVDNRVKAIGPGAALR